MKKKKKINKYRPVTGSTEHKTEILTSRVLRFGLVISSCLLVSGLLSAAIWPSSVTLFSENPPLGSLISKLLSGSFDPVTLMFSGLVLLMFTPVLRVITAVFGFTAEKDWQFVAISSLVLVLLAGEIIYSLYIK